MPTPRLPIHMMFKSPFYIYFTLFIYTMPTLVAADANKESSDIYAKTCSVCHGEQGDGKSHAIRGLIPPPRDFSKPGLKSKLTRDTMIQIVTNGKPGTAMTGFSSQLNQTQISELVDYIREQFMYDNVGKSILKRNTSGGKSIYALTCSVCHGEDGAGAVWGKTSFNPPPVNFATQDRVRDLPRERMIYSVTHGRPNTAMTAFETQLNAKEIEQVVDYIRDTFMIESSTSDSTTNDASSAQAASTVGMAVLHDKSKESDSLQQITDAELFNQPISAELRGNLQTGQAFYLQNCTDCHGISGEGDGPRAYFIYPRPRNFLHSASKARFNRPVLFEAIKQGVNGREMPAWGKVLNDQQIADITEYVFQTFIRPSTEVTQ